MALGFTPFGWGTDVADKRKKDPMVSFGEKTRKHRSGCLMQTTPSNGAPGGWGFLPGMQPVVEVEADHLPELPMLRFLTTRMQCRAIVKALSELPYLRRVEPRHVAARYGLTPQQGHRLLMRAKGKGGASERADLDH